MAHSNGRARVMTSPIQLVCPAHQGPINCNDGGYTGPCGCVYPIVNGVPRFVSMDNYANAFGLQWNRYARTQLDSHTHTSVSRTRLTRILGGDLGVVRGKLVLEVGCGAGRFTEILLNAGAKVVATDLSSAVEANFRNCQHFSRYFVCQADLRALPFPRESFEYVICVGVVQHTPDPEATMAALCAQLAPGGLLAMDHYSDEYPISVSRRALRACLLRCSPAVALRLSTALTNLLWPGHRLAWHSRHVPVVRKFAGRFVKYSPVIDHHYYTPELSPSHLYEWALLDTHDTLTDRYKHLRTPDQIRSHLQACGLKDIVVTRGGNGVEARAQKSSL